MDYLIADLKKAILRLEEVLKMEKTPVTRDSAIKRFELCFDLMWKTLKAYAKNEGLECNSPRSCIKTAFQLNIIAEDPTWLDMILDRNLSVHLYDEDSADKIYKKLEKYLKLFIQVTEKFSK